VAQAGGPSPPDTRWEVLSGKTEVKVLLAVDGSVYTKRMLSFLAARDGFLGPNHDFTVIHGVPAVSHRAAAFVGKSVVRQFHESEAERVFKPIRSFLRQQGIEAKFVYRVGHAAEAISRFAEEGRFDLVAMGSRGRSNIVNLLLGSVALKVLARCSVPVLLIR